MVDRAPCAHRNTRRARRFFVLGWQTQALGGLQRFGVFVWLRPSDINVVTTS